MKTLVRTMIDGERATYLISRLALIGSQASLHVSVFSLPRPFIDWHIMQRFNVVVLGGRLHCTYIDVLSLMASKLEE